MHCYSSLLRGDVRGMKTDDTILDKEYIKASILINDIRCSLTALDSLLHAQHKRRHPIAIPPLDFTPTQPLDAETRIEIDNTP